MFYVMWACKYVTLASGMIFVTKQTFKQFQPLIVTKNHDTIPLYIKIINFFISVSRSNLDTDFEF